MPEHLPEDAKRSLQAVGPVTARTAGDGDSPAWDSISFEVRCSRCDYNLRMLTRPRCPECGLEFTWPDVLDRGLRRSNFLFEHRWRDQWMSSLARTVWAGFRPRRFWSRVSIHDAIQPGPLVVLVLLAPALFLITFHLLSLTAGGLLWLIAVNGQSAAPWDYAALLIADVLRFIGSRLRPRESISLRMAGFLWVALLAGSGVLCLLRQTLGRCRIRTLQILRVTAYAAPPMFVWLAVATICSLVATILARSSVQRFSLWVNMSIGVEFAPSVLIYVWFLSVPLRRYLGLPHARFVAVLCAIVGVLAAATCFIAVIVFLEGGW